MLETELEERELGATDEGATEDGATDDSATDEGATEDGGVEEGATEDTLDEAGIDDGATEALERLLDDTTELLPPTIPQGAGCEAQVEREIHDLLFSYPQPLCVFTHSG